MSSERPSEYFYFEKDTVTFNIINDTLTLNLGEDTITLNSPLDKETRREIEIAYSKLEAKTVQKKDTLTRREQKQKKILKQLNSRYDTINLNKLQMQQQELDSLLRTKK